MLECIVLISDGIESKKDNRSLGFLVDVAQCFLQPPVPILVSAGKHQKFSNTFRELI